MNPKAMIWISVALSAIAQLFLKRGLTKVQIRRRDNGVFSLGIQIFSEVLIWSWGLCFVAAMALWLAGLQRLDLSYAYPLVSVGYILVTLFSFLLFKERVNSRRWLAVAVISIGVILIAGS